VLASIKFSPKEHDLQHQVTVAQQEVLATATGGEDCNISGHKRQ
jgi:hypothetical protein